MMKLIPNTIKLKTLDGEQTVTLAFYGAFKGDPGEDVSGGDLFDTKILAGYRTMFTIVEIRDENDDPHTVWRHWTDEYGNYYIKPWSGVEGLLSLNTQGETIAGEFAYRQFISTDPNTEIEVDGLLNGQIKRCTSNSAGGVDVIIKDFVLAGNNNFYTNGFFDVVQAGNASITISGEDEATVTAPGGLPKTSRKGDKLRVICIEQDVYEVYGDIQRLVRERVVELTSEDGVLTIDWALGNNFTYTPTENISSVVHLHLPVDTAQHIIIRMKNHASDPKTIDPDVWDVQWFPKDDPFTPTMSENALDEVALSCYGDSSVIIGKYSRDAD